MRSKYQLFLSAEALFPANCFLHILFVRKVYCYCRELLQQMDKRLKRWERIAF